MDDKRRETIEKLDRLAESVSWDRISNKIDRVLIDLVEKPEDDFWEEADKISHGLAETGRKFSDSTELVREDRDR